MCSPRATSSGGMPVKWRSHWRSALLPMAGSSRSSACSVIGSKANGNDDVQRATNDRKALLPACRSFSTDCTPSCA